MAPIKLPYPLGLIGGKFDVKHTVLPTRYTPSIYAQEMGIKVKGSKIPLYALAGILRPVLGKKRKRKKKKK